jgi:endonuclease G
MMFLYKNINNTCKIGIKMKHLKALICLLLIGTVLNIQAEDNIIEEDEFIFLNYLDYGIKYNCTKKGFDMFMFDTVPDGGNFPRADHFFQDKRLPARCMQQSVNTYKSPAGHQKFDRGHGKNANVVDHNEQLIKETNFMTNIVPHDRTLNRHGLWRHLEKVTECFRDSNDLHIVGGNIWGDDSSNDYFLKSHGVVTPDFIYKIIMINESKIFAFLMPNNKIPTYYNGTEYITTVSDIEEQIGYEIRTIPDRLKDSKEKYVPRTPKSCSIK